jgi:hypothetical protein
MRVLFANNWIRIAIGVFFALISVSLFAIAMCRGLNRDEHQFIAAGTLLARQGLLPYRDYAYFHFPNLVFVYAGLFRCSKHLLLSSRLFSVLCSLALLVIIYRFSSSRLEQLHKRARLAVAGAITVCAFSNPIFRFTCWRAWNHPLPVLLTVLGCLCHFDNLARNSMARLVWTGALIGFAAGSRLTFAPAALAFLAVIFCSEMGLRGLRRAGWFSLGLMLGLLPAIVLFLMCPNQFVFGNFGYNAKLYPMLCRIGGLEHEMSPFFKLRYFLTNILSQPGNAALILGLGYFLVRSGAWRWARDPGSWLLPLLSGTLFLGALVAAIPLPQYFYAPVPLAVIGLAISIAKTTPMLRKDYCVLFIVTMVCIASTAVDYRYLGRLFQPEAWATIKVHRAGRRLASLTGQGKVLTLSPIFPLEGGLRIYPELTAEPFACRSASFLRTSARVKYKMLAIRDFPRLLIKEPAQGILVSSDSVLDQSLAVFATTHGYQKFPVVGEISVYLPPTRIAASR